jgi:hypothetical protein
MVRFECVFGDRASTFGVFFALISRPNKLPVYTVTSLWYTILPSLAAGDGIHERPKFRRDMHCRASQSKTTKAPSHDETSRSPTRPVPSKHPLNHPLLKLQQTIGNQGVQRLLHSQPIQGLRPSQGGLLQRKCACGGTPGLDGECADCRRKRLPLQRHPVAPADRTEAPPIVDEVLRSPGQPLDPTTRAFMEPRFGHDFSRVRVHTDPRAAESAQAVNALAYTVGGNVVFGAGRYEPRTGEGRRLLAHELTHVAQQHSEQPVSLQKQSNSNETGDALETEAEQATAELDTDSADEAEAELGATIPETALAAAGKGGTQQPGKKMPGFGLTVTGPSGCVPTTMTTGGLTSSASIEVDYVKNNDDPGDITLRQRETGDKVLHTVLIGKPRSGHVIIPAGISITNENHHYELEMTFTNRKGTVYGGLQKSRPTIKFEVCSLKPTPTGEHLLFAKAIYAEGVNAGEFPYVRDLVFNRIDWVKQCPGDERDFGNSITSVLNKPNQFDSVLSNTDKFRELEQELKDHSGSCQYTTPPRSTKPATCRLINAAIDAEAAGDGNTHNYVYFRSNAKSPNITRAVNQWQYRGGNFYWEIKDCPPDRQKKTP